MHLLTQAQDKGIKMAYNYESSLLKVDGSGTNAIQFFEGLIFDVYGDWGNGNVIIQSATDLAFTDDVVTELTAKTSNFAFICDGNVDTGRFVRATLADADDDTNLTVRSACRLANKGEDASEGGGGEGVPDYILLQHQAASGVAGGGSTSGAFEQNKLTKIVFDSGEHVTLLAANRFTLAAGTYEYKIRVPIYNSDQSVSQFLEGPGVTDVVIEIGMSVYAPSGDNGFAIAEVSGVFTSAGAIYEIQTRVSTSAGTNGYGVSHSFGVLNKYTQIELWKIS